MAILPSTFELSPGSPLPPAGTHIVLTSTLASSFDLCLFHLVFGALKENAAARGGKIVPESTRGQNGGNDAAQIEGRAERKVVIVDLAGKGRAWWDAVGRKLGSPISSATPAPTFITPTSLPQPSSTNKSDSTEPDPSPSLFESDSDLPTLEPLSRSIITAFRSQNNANGILRPSGSKERIQQRPGLLILDDLSTLLWMGFGSAEISRLIRGLKGAAAELNFSLISALHAPFLPTLASSTSLNIASPTPSAGLASLTSSEDPELDLLLRILRLGGGVWWRVEGLGSGLSGVVSGEISVHLLPPFTPSTTSLANIKAIPRSNPRQYKIEDGGMSVRVFAKGTGEGYM